MINIISTGTITFNNEEITNIIARWVTQHYGIQVDKSKIVFTGDKVVINLNKKEDIIKLIKDGVSDA